MEDLFLCQLSPSEEMGMDMSFHLGGDLAKGCPNIFLKKFWGRFLKENTVFDLAQVNLFFQFGCSVRERLAGGNGENDIDSFEKHV